MIRPGTVFLASAVVAVAGLVSVIAEAGKPVVPTGILAMSAGETVVLVNPGNPETLSLDTGPVGFLFPAPSGVLFAPDIANDRTSVIDLRAGRIVDLIAGVTMPHFGPRQDRYLVVAGALTMVSYPERSLIFRMEGVFDRPWQVQLGPEGMTVLILERSPSGEGGSVVSAVDLGNRRVIFTKQFENDLMWFGIGPAAGVMPFVDRTSGEVLVLDLMTLSEICRLPVPDGATDVVVLKEGKEIVVAGAAGRLLRWKLIPKSQGLKVESDDSILIKGRATRLAVGPEGRFVAAATDQGELVIGDSKKGDTVGRWEVPSQIRDLQWVDDNRRGPLLPSWSDNGFGPEGADLGVRKK